MTLINEYRLIQIMIEYFSNLYSNSTNFINLTYKQKSANHSYADNDMIERVICDSDKQRIDVSYNVFDQRFKTDIDLKITIWFAIILITTKKKWLMGMVLKQGI